MNLEELTLKTETIIMGKFSRENFMGEESWFILKTKNGRMAPTIKTNLFKC